MREILIFSEESDLQAQYFYKELLKIGENVIFISWEDFPNNITLSYDIPFNGTYTLSVKGKQIKNPKSIYWRNYFGPSIGNISESPFDILGSTDGSKKMTLFRNNETMLKSFFEIITDCLWVNPPQSVYAHWNKPLQMNMFAGSISGVLYPKTIISNNYHDIIKICDLDSQGRVILKPVLGGFSTQLVDKKSMKKYKDTFKIFPCTIQEYIEGDNIRVYVVGDNIYPLKIISSLVDYRDATYKAIPIKIPKKVEKACQEIAKKAQYLLTGIDLRRSLDSNKYYFLETNPSPIFLKDAFDTGYPIIEDFMKLLIKGTKTC